MSLTLHWNSSIRRNPSRRSRRLALEALEPRTLLDSGGPRIVGYNPMEVRNTVFDHVDAVFDRAIDPTTITTQDVTIEGPSGPVDATGIEAVDDHTFRV